MSVFRSPGRVPEASLITANEARRMAETSQEDHQRKAQAQADELLSEVMDRIREATGKELCPYYVTVCLRDRVGLLACKATAERLRALGYEAEADTGITGPLIRVSWHPEHRDAGPD